MKTNLIRLLSIALVFLVSCSKDENNENLLGNVSTVKTTIVGRIFDENGAALSGADVYIGNKSSSTNLWGIYVIEDAIVVKERTLISVKKTGYWDQVGTFKPTSGGTSYTSLCLFQLKNTHTIDALLGGTITTVDGASIQFPSDAFEKLDGSSYSGTVALTFHHVPRSSDQFSLKVPGTDFKGKSLNNTLENLVCFGMVGATLKDGSGNEVKLKSGKKATVSLPVHSTQLAIATPSIPLWHFNEVTAIWEEEGTAIFNGSNYTGEVSHFTWWSYNLPNGIPVSGNVYDCQQLPLGYSWIYINGLCADFTSQSGTWSNVVPPNTNLTLQAFHYNGFSVDSTAVINIPPISPQPNYIAPALNFTNTNCNSISGTVTNCAGQAISATIIVIVNNQVINYKYTTNGIFQLSLGNIGANPIQIIAFNGLQNTSVTTTMGGSNSINVGQLSLCTTSPLNNKVRLTFNNWMLTNYPFTLEVSHCTLNSISGHYEIICTYTDSASLGQYTFNISIPTYSTGVYPWNGIGTYLGGFLYYDTQYYIQPSGAGPGGSTTITNAPGPGGNITGSFSGPVWMSGGLTDLVGTLSGSFDIYRNN
jgi:hypothetical protein